MPDILDEGHGRLQVVGKAGPGVEFEGQPHARVGRPRGRLRQAHREPGEVLRRKRSECVARDDEHGDGEFAEQPETAFEMRPVLAPGIALAGEQAALEAGRDGRDATGLEQPLQVTRAVALEIGFGVAEPEVDGITVAGRVVVENRLEAAIERADGG